MFLIARNAPRVILNLYILPSSGRIVHEKQSQHSKNKLLIFRNVYFYIYVNYG